MSVVTFFKLENENSIIAKFNLPEDVFRNGLLKVVDSTAEDDDIHLVNIHYEVHKLEELLKNRSMYTPEQIVSISKIRGLCYDCDDDEVVCISYPYTSTLRLNSVPFGGSQPLPFINELGKKEFATPQKYSYTECFNGAIFRVFKHKGKVFGSSFRKIDASHSWFGKSECFVDIFLNEQTVFKTLDSIYEHSDDDVIHIFLLNSNHLLTDERDYHIEDRIIYLKSYSVKNPEKDCSGFKTEIEALNIDFENPYPKQIFFPRELDALQVNQYLYGTMFKSEVRYDIPILDYNNVPSENIKILKDCGVNALSLFCDGRKIIYQNEYGIFTISSESNFFRNHFMKGVINPQKMFCDMYSTIDTPYMDRVIVPIGFSLESLREIHQKIINHETFNLLNYEMILDKPDLIVLTNLFFCVPIHLIDQCFEAYETLGTKMINAANFFILHKTELNNQIANKSIEKFKGMHSISKGMKELLIRNIPKCFTKKGHTLDIGENPKWPESVKLYYRELAKTAAKLKTPNEISNLSVASLILNAYGSVLYSLITFEKKYQLTLISHSKN